MKKTRSEITRLLEQNRDAIREFGVRSLALFGSAARDEATDASDLDFVVEFTHKTFDGYMGLKFFLEDLLQSKVDLVIRETIKPRLRDAILSSAIHAPEL